MFNVRLSEGRGVLSGVLGFRNALPDQSCRWSVAAGELYVRRRDRPAVKADDVMATELSGMFRPGLAVGRIRHSVM